MYFSRSLSRTRRVPGPNRTTGSDSFISLYAAAWLIDSLRAISPARSSGSYSCCGGGPESGFGTGRFISFSADAAPLQLPAAGHGGLASGTRVFSPAPPVAQPLSLADQSPRTLLPA